MAPISLRKKRTRQWLFCLIVGMLFLPAHAQDPDSILYCSMREELLALTTLTEEQRAYLAAAAGLADDSLYAEAYDLLTWFFDEQVEAEQSDLLEEQTCTDQPAPQLAPPEATKSTAEQGKQNITWKMRAHAGYDTYDEGTLSAESDSLAFTGDEILVYTDTVSQEIHDEQFDGGVRLTMTWRPQNDIVNDLRPYVYLSNRRIKGGTKLDLSLFDHLSAWAFSLEAEKKLNEAYGDSSDVTRGNLYSMTSVPLGRSPVNLGLRLEIDFDNYLRNRSGYVSRRRYSATQTVGVERLSSPCISASAGGRFEYTDYDELNDDDDVLRYGPCLEMSLWHRALSLNVNGDYYRERYPGVRGEVDAYNPLVRHSLEVEGRASFTPVSWITANLDYSLLAQREQHGRSLVYSTDTSIYDDTTDIMDTVTYRVRGVAREISGGLRFPLRFGLALEAGFTYTWNNYPVVHEVDGVELDYGRSIWNSLQNYAPLVGVSYESEIVRADLSFEAQMENIWDETDLSDSWTLSPFLDMSVKLRTWLTIDGQADYRYRQYKDPDQSPSESWAASMGLGVVF